MAKIKKGNTRGKIFRLIGDRVDIAAGVILALLWQAKAAAAEGSDGPAAPSATAALPGEARLIAAIDDNSLTSLSLDELRALLTPQDLARLGLDPQVFGDLLAADPKAALIKLDAAFRSKLKLVAASGPATSAKVVSDAPEVAGSDAGPAGADGDAGGGSGILYALGGLLGAGGVAGLAGGGGSAAPVIILPPTPVNAAPVATADAVTTSEDTPVIFDVRSNDSDANGDALTVTAINGTAISVNTPVSTTGGSVSLGADGRLTFTPALNFNGPASFSYTIADGKGGSATATTTLTVNAVNDAPVNAGPSASIAAVQAVTVAVSGLAIVDADAGSSPLTTTLSVASGVLFVTTVADGAAVTGSASAAVTLTGTLAQINASLAAITYRGNPGFAGTDRLTVSTNDGAATDTDSFSISVVAVQSGVVSDGYIAGGTVFIDVNGNGAFDTGEPSAQTDGAGNFSIVGNTTGTIIAIGGINADTGLPNLITMRAPMGSTVVNPLTTIVEQLISGGATAAQANASVATAFGLPAGIDFGSFDILAATDPVLGLAAQKAAIEVATLLTMARQAAGPADSDSAEAMILARITDLVADGGVDLGDAPVLRTLFTDVPGIAAGDVGGLVGATGAFLAAIDASGSLAELTDAIIVGSTPPATPPGNLQPVTTADSVVTTIGTPVTFNPVTNDRDANGDTLAISAIDGRAIAIDQPVAVAGGNVALNVDGSLTFTPATAFTGSPQFAYTVSDGAGGSAQGMVSVAVTPGGASLGIAAADLGAFVDNAGALASAGVETLDLAENSGSISDAQASALIGAGIDFAEADTISVAAEGTHLGTTLKGLQDLNVDHVTVGLGAVSVAAGTAGLAGITADGLPNFTAAAGNPDVTLTLAGGTLADGVDLALLAPALASAGIDHIGTTGDNRLSVTFEQASALTGSGLDFAPVSDITVRFDPSAAGTVAEAAGSLAGSHVDHLAAIGGAIILSDSQAGDLVSAGLDFAETDDVSVAAEGTQLTTTLKGLQDLNVDHVTVGLGTVSVAAGTAGLAGIAADGLPNFTATAGNPDVTLTLAGGTLADGVDLALLAPALASAGIDHIGTTGDNRLSVTFEQASALTGSGLDFAPASDITVRFDPSAAGAVAEAAGSLAGSHVDHLAAIGGAIILSDSQAGDLVSAGLDFAETDDVSVAAEGTQLTTTLKGLQDLNVDHVTVGLGTVSVAAGTAGLAGIAADGLPNFTATAGNPDVTLTLAGGTLADGVDLALLAPALASAGIDHIGTTGDNRLSVTFEQASALTGSGLDFAPASDITVRFDPSAAGAVAEAAGSLAGSHVDHLAAIGGAIILSDSQAGDLVSAGLDFAESDDVSVAAEGTQLTTTLKGLHDLNVDSVSVQPGIQTLHVAAGNLAAIAESGLPQFDTGAGSPLDITLAVTTADLLELPRLAEALRAAGIDHIAIDSPLDGLSASVAGMLADITAATGIDFVEQAAPVATSAALLGTLLAEFEGDSQGGQAIELNDAVVASIVQAGMLGAYLAENLTIDATGAGAKPQTSLMSVAELKADAVLLADQHDAPVYIDLGIDASAIGELQSLFAALDPGTGYSKIFTGSDQVALVVDARTADLLAGVDGALDHLAQLGFTEIDVLAGNSASLLVGDGTIEVKLIGHDDDLYDYLNHGRG